MNVSLDWTIKLGDILTIIAIAGTALGFLYTLRGKVDVLGDRVKHIEMDLSKFVEILITLGKQDERMKSHDVRISELEKATPRTKRR